MQGQVKATAVTRETDSPYAKYNSRGQLMCIICGTPVKSKIIWQAHINKRSHKENFAKLKEKQEKISNLPNQKSKIPGNKEDLFKRPTCSTNPKITKKLCTERPKGILKKICSYDSPEEESDGIDLSFIKKESFSDIKETVKTELPTFYHETVRQSQNGDKVQSTTESQVKKESPVGKPNATDTLPEGFFDDPVADAKARNVEYRDKEEEEWLSFMKEVSAAEMVSEKIIAEDKEEAAFETQIEQTNEQIKCLERIVVLDKEKTTQLQVKKVNSSLSDSGDSSDEEFCPVIWRTKNSLI